MHIPTISVILTLIISLTLASPLDRRAKPDNAKLVIEDVKTINKEAKNLNDTLNTFGPFDLLGLVKALEIQRETKTLEDSIQTAIKHASASKKWTGGESGKIATVNLNLKPTIHSLLTNIVAHKPAFATAVLGVGDLSKTVEQSLVEQRELSAELGNAIIQNLAQPYKKFAPAVNKQILGYFDKAINKYKSCSGVLCLPPL